MKNDTKNVLILTHELGGNYGGIMQAYALQQVIKQLGYDPLTSSPHKPSSKIRTIASRIKSIVSVQLLRMNGSVVNPYTYNSTTINMVKFVDKNIKLVKATAGNSNLSNIAMSSRLVITGSDQVWRNNRVDILAYFLNFIQDTKTRRISYAASFGKDDITEYTPEMTRAVGRLIERFNGVSVRESSGVDICKSQWQVKADHHVDPTMLLDSIHYRKLTEHMDASKKDLGGKIFTYILDRSDQKEAIINKVSHLTGLQPEEALPPECKSIFGFLANKKKYRLPHVESWINGFASSDFIVTDSFHGCVFSIIFNKPFIAIGNKDRGLARFTSLLKMFSLTDRLATNSEDITSDLVKKSINWDDVNSKIKNEQSRSIEYLEKHLS